MFLFQPDKKTYRWLIPLSALFIAIIIINPIASFDILLLGLLLLIVGHVFLQEKLILAFIILRPALDYWRDVVLFQYKNTVLNLNAVLAILLIIWSLWILLKYKSKIKSLPLKLTLPLLALVMLGSSVYSVSPLISLIETIKFLSILVLFFLAYILTKEKKLALSELLISIVISAIIPVIMGALQIILGTGMSTFGLHGRIYGTFAHPNVFAFFILFLLFLHIQYSTIQPLKFWQKHKIFLLTFYFLLSTLLLMTYTRAALIGLLVFLIVIGILKYRKALLWLIGGIALFYIVFYPLNHYLIQTHNYNLQQISILNRLTSRNEDADSIEWRRTLIREAAPLIRAKLLLGYGYGSFPIVWEANRSMSHLWDDSAEAHNDYLRLTLEIGLIGLFLYLILLTRFTHLSIKLLKEDKQKYIYFLGWVIAFIVISVSDNMLHHTAVMWLMWSWWGATLATSYKPQSIEIE